MSYDYDGIGRLTKADAASGTDYSYEYDDRGNITKKTIAGSATTYAYDAANEICWSASGSVTAPACSNAPSGATTYSFDAAGNLSATSVGLSAGYNSRNQMTSVTPPGGASIAMAYMDMSSDRRILAGDTRMAYSQVGLQSQGPNNGGPHGTWFVREPSGTLSQMLEVDAAKKDLYYHLDGLGSIIATTDAAGNVVRRYAYEPYGKELGTATEIHGDPNPWRYASGYYDKGTSWLKFGTRHYDPHLGRWTQRDPVFGTPSNPHTLNPYGYVGGDPVNAIDPTGRFFHDEDMTFGNFFDRAFSWGADVGGVGMVAGCAIGARFGGVAGCRVAGGAGGVLGYVGGFASGTAVSVLDAAEEGFQIVLDLF